MSEIQTFLRPAAKMGYSNATSGLVATNVQAAIDELDSTLDAAVLNISNLETLSGVAGATDLGTFTGSTIPDASNIKSALQALETEVETKLTSSLFDANTILKADTDDTPVALTVAPSTLVGRGAAGNISALSAADVRTIINVEDGATADQSAAEVPFSNATSGLAATDVQAAIDEVEGRVDTAEINITAAQGNITNLETLSGSAGATDHGTFTGSTISDSNTTKGALQELETAVELRALDADVIKKDGSVAFTADQDMGGFKLTGLAAPTLGTDAVNKDYADGLIAGVSAKDPVELATTANITLSGEQTIDGVLTSGTRILVKDQSTASENGIYVTAAGAWARADDADGTPANEVAGGDSVFVTGGTANVDTMFRLQGTGNISVGVGAQNWIFYSRAEATSASNGLVKVGLDFQLADASANAISVSSGAISALVDDSTIEISSNALQVKDQGISAAKLGAVAGTGLTGGAGSALAIDFGTSGTLAVSASSLASTANGLGASLIGVEDAAGNYTGTNVESVLTEIDGRLDTLESGGTLDWQLISSATTAADGQKLLADTSSSAFTVTLPLTPSAGDEVIIRDAKRTSETNAITVGRNGENIGGLAEDMTVNINGIQVHLVYVDAAHGWSVEAS